VINQTVPDSDIHLVRGPMGWGDDNNTPIDKRHDHESRLFDKLASDMPVAYRARESVEISNPMMDRLRKLHDSKNYGSDSYDLTLIDEMIYGKRLQWLPQKTGSCVVSNTFRPWTRRALFEVVVKGDAEELLGRNEFSTNNLSFYAPFSYGCGRRRGNLKGNTERNDGSWCEIQYESLIKDGVILCNNGKLLEILSKLNAVGDQDFPEPQNNSVYRRFQNWEFLDTLLPFTDFRLLESPRVTDIDSHLALHKQFKPMSVCSGIAIHKIGTHKDGFPIHAQNPRDSWGHCMSFQGYFTASDGKVYIRLSNESWGANLIYNIPVEEVSRWYSRKAVTVQAVGEIDLPDSVPLL
jgi:hypothetical protein